MLLLLLLLAGLPLAAQISPGPLARAHQSLNVPTNCTTCHRISAGQPEFKCLECHTEIAGRIAAGKGLHATYNLKVGSSQECVRCHAEHNGEDFPLIKLDTRTFDHQQTGYDLEGKHSGLACNRCHAPEHIAPAQRASIKNPARTFLGLTQNCDHAVLGQSCRGTSQPLSGQPVDEQIPWLR